jgi:hypothetical protein
MKRAEFEQMWDGLVADQFGSNSKELEGVTAEEYAAAIMCDDEQALPTSRCMQAHEQGDTEYHQRMIIRGSAVHVYWQFDADAMDAAGDDEGNLDWSLDSIARIVYA